jgi:hypothetical protein
MRDLSGDKHHQLGSRMFQLLTPTIARCLSIYGVKCWQNSAEYWWPKIVIRLTGGLW